MKHTFKIIREEEQEGCWVFEIEQEATSEELSRRKHRLRLSWEDYDLWVRDGTVEPAAVAMAILKYLQSGTRARELPDRIDSSYPRKLDPQADDLIAGLIDPVMFRAR